MRIVALILFILIGSWREGYCQTNGDLHVGMELTYPPFEMIDTEGKPSGISVEIANSLGAFLGKAVIIENIPFIGLIPALKSGKIDLIISSMSATKEREQSIDFSDPYLHTGLCLLVSKNSSIISIRDANKKRRIIAVKQGTSGCMYAQEHLKEAEVLVLDKEASCVLEVVQGKADAFIYDQLSIYKHWQKNPDTTKAILNPFAIEYWAIGMRKGEDSLKREVNAFLKYFRESKSLEVLGDQYFKKQKEIFKEMNIPFYF